MSLQFDNFTRKPYSIEALQISEFNIAEVAELIGELQYKEDGTPFIQVNKNVVPYVNRVYPGFWLTRVKGQYRCYPRKTFFQQFEAATSADTGTVINQYSLITSDGQVTVNE